MSDDFALDFIRDMQKRVEASSSAELEKYLSLLNPEQRSAVEQFDSPLLILAGAGSGKTRVITTKIAYLINQKNVPPHAILAVTFTKKAAKEMRDRAVLMEQRAEASVIRTFHSFGAWFLRKYFADAGVDKNFTVYDDDDTVSLLMKAVPGLDKNRASHVAHLISLAKDYGYTPDSAGLTEISANADFPRMYRLYEDRLRKTGNVDFGDLILLPVLLLEQNEKVRSQMQYRFKVILVDEYQDSNLAQFRLLKALSLCPDGKKSGTYVCVVGDDDQSIYKFRGAEVQNILSFQTEFPGTKLIRLERNYRSTDKILAAADSIISKNENRLGKTLIAERGKGKKPVLVFLPNQDEEAKFCASMISQSYKKGCPYNDWAVLYRTNAQSLTFESEFLHQKIPYRVVGSLKFYEREEIKDMLAFLSLAANQKDEISFRRIVNKPRRGIGDTAQDKIVSSALSDSGIESLVASCRKTIPSLSKKAGESAGEFCSVMEELIQSISSPKKDSLLSEFVELVMNKSGLYEYHKAQDEMNGTQRAGNMEELVNSAVLYEYSMEGLLEFLEHIELDRTIENDGDDASDAVTLITLHNTKGLEFNRVVITGLEQGIFPRENKTAEELEEERRLFYVGITRAKDELYVTSCASRRLYGRFSGMEPSIFLNEMGEQPFRILGERPFMFSGGAHNAEAESGCGEWKTGTRIYHDDYGYGNIIKSFSREGELVIVVQFETGGTKSFLPAYQKSSLMIIKD